MDDKCKIWQHLIIVNIYAHFKVLSIFITTFRDNTSSGILLELPPFVLCFLLFVCLVEEVELPLAGSMVKIYYISQV